MGCHDEQCIRSKGVAEVVEPCGTAIPCVSSFAEMYTQSQNVKTRTFS